MTLKILKEKINASIILGSYLDTLGFYNGIWEFNFRSNMKINDLQTGSYINYEILIIYLYFSISYKASRLIKNPQLKLELIKTVSFVSGLYPKSSVRYGLSVLITSSNIKLNNDSF